MKKYILNSFGYDNRYCVLVEAENIQEAFAKFIEYYGLPYSLEYKDVQNMVKEFNIEKFIDFFENKQNHTVYGLYEVKDTLFEKKINYFD